MADNGTDKQQPTQALRNPLEDAKRVVEMLRSDGTIDETYKQVMDALRQDEEFQQRLTALLRNDGLMAEGRCYSPLERSREAQAFVRKHESALLALARDAVYKVLTSEERGGLAPSLQGLVHAALIGLLSEEEASRQRHLRQLQQQEFARLARPPPASD